MALTRTVADGCEPLRTVGQRQANTPPPPDPQSETGTLATHSGKTIWGFHTPIFRQTHIFHGVLENLLRSLVNLLRLLPLLSLVLTSYLCEAALHLQLKDFHHDAPGLRPRVLEQYEQHSMVHHSVPMKTVMKDHKSGIPWYPALNPNSRASSLPLQCGRAVHHRKPRLSGPASHGFKMSGATVPLFQDQTEGCNKHMLIPERAIKSIH